jgi:hypothetical protein
MMTVGCATNQARNGAAAATISVQTVQYFPFQVKGYEGTYPKRQVVVLTAVDARDFKDAGTAGHEPFEGHPAIGMVLAEDGKVSQRLYGPALDELITTAVAQAAQEAGMIAVVSSNPLKAELSGRRADYVVSATIVRCWVIKHRGQDRGGGPSWRSEAVVTLQATVYKPPFDVAFWSGDSSSTYDDPPSTASGGMGMEDSEIYDQPGEVLSVALTRAVAGLFQHDDLRTLITQDPIRPH